MSRQILHCIPAEKFTDPFIDFVHKHFDLEAHRFIVKQLTAFEVEARSQVVRVPKQTGWLELFKAYAGPMNQADKIILHSLFDNKLTFLLALQPWLIDKCVWVIWGGDLYSSLAPARSLKGLLVSTVRRFVIRRLSGIATIIDGDYQLARQHFDKCAKCYPCFVYPSNLVATRPVTFTVHKGINVLVGNSADPSNHHMEILDRLATENNGQLQVIVPLSYGDRAYAQKVIRHGVSLFGEKFHALESFLPRAEYTSLLNNIDIAIFNHDRQQALGNIITLLGLGKKDYVRATVTHWAFFERLGVAINNVKDIQLTTLDAALQEKNRYIIGEYFNSANLRRQLESLFA